MHQLLLNIRLSALRVLFSVADISLLLFGVALDRVWHVLKLPERGWRLAPGFALLKTAALIIRTTHFLYSSHQRITYVRLKTTSQRRSDIKTSPIPSPDKILGTRGSRCQTNVTLGSSTGQTRINRSRSQTSGYWKSS